jgi:hypothetical protein
VEEYRLGICDCDTGYMLGLMDYMNMSQDIPFHVSVFTSVQDMGRDIEDGRVDMLLVNDSEEAFDKLKNEGLPVVKLTETRELQDGQGYIFKYQSMEDIGGLLYKIARKNLKTNTTMHGGVYAVYSPVGRCGVSTYALRLAEEADKSLLVKLENFRAKTGVEDDAFMYYLLSHNKAIGDIVRNMRLSEGPCIVDGPLSYQDIRELKREDIEWFKKLAADEDFCETMVFDIGSGALGNFDVLLAFDTVYVPCIKGMEEKLDSFKKAAGYGSEYEKIFKFIDATSF